jgi:hypothetical protein
MDTPHVTDVATAELQDWGPLAEATGPEMTTRGLERSTTASPTPRSSEPLSCAS